MSFVDDFNKGLKKYNVSKQYGSDYAEEFYSALEKEEKKKRDYLAEYERLREENPMGGDKDSWFKSGGFSDGVDSVGDFFVDLGETALGTIGDLGLGVLKGAGRLVEGVVDLGTYGVAGVASLFGADEFAQDAKNFATTSYVDELTKETEEILDKYSILGDKADMVSEGLGQVATIVLTGGIAGAAGLGTAGSTVVTTGLIGASGMGSGMSEAYSMGATDEEAVTYGLISGASEAITELLFGGLGKASKAIGVGKGLSSADDILAKKISSKFSSQIAKNFAEYGIKAGAEGTEEVLSGIMQAAGKKMTYMSEEEFSKILADEDLLEQFVVGTVTSGFAQSGYVPGMQNGSLREANKTGRDFITGLTQNEQFVVDKVVEDTISKMEAEGKVLSKKEKGDIYDSVLEQMEHGQLNIDDIESVLGGDAYKAYKDHIESEEALKAELAELRGMKSGEMTDIQTTRMNELKGMNLEDTTKRDALKKQLDDTISPLLQGSKLAETYRERARRGEAFQADLSKYTGKQREAVERAINSGVLNDTYKSHRLVDTLSKIEAEKGITFDYTDNAKLKESGFAVEGRTVNGFENNGTVTLNIQSAKAWESVVGHEITHILEGTEHYSALQSALFDYAKSRGELDRRRADLTKLYNGMNANIDAELTADLVGDYLFTDSGFIKNLTSNRNLFQKIYDEIKYLCKIATGKQLTEIEKVKREFDKAWKEMSVESVTENEATNAEIDDVNYSISVTDENVLDSLNAQIAKGEYNAETNPDGGYYVTYKSMSFWGYDEDGNAILRSPMAEYVDGELSNAYLIPKDKSKLNWYQATETIDEKTGLPSGLMVKVKKEGNKSFSYLPAVENQDLIADDWSNLYFNLQKKVLKNGKWTNSDVPARYNPYEHSSNSMLNDQFSAAYLRDNLVTVKMYVPISEDNGAYRAQWSKDATGWADWKTGTVAGKINKQKDLQRKVYLSRYAAPVEIVPDSEVAQAYKEYLEGTDVTIPDNVVSPNLLNELKKAGVPITESGKVKYSVSEGTQEADGEYLKAVENGDTETAQRMVEEAAKNAGYTVKAYHGTPNSEFTVFDKERLGEGNDQYGAGFYFASNKTSASYYGNRIIDAALNIKKPIRITATRDSGTNLINAEIELTSKQAYEVVKRHPDMYDDENSPLGDYYDSYWEYGAQDWMVKSLAEQYRDVGYLDSDLFRNYPNELHEALRDVVGYDGVEVTFESTGEKFYVAWFENQMKSTDTITYDDNGNIIPLSERFNTANNDIRFSLSEAVEETKDLVALHNLTADKLTKSLELGGLPMPSLAITKADIPHDNFGEITLIFGKKTINPKANKKNKVYSADAWTPTFPRVEYEADGKVVDRVSQKLTELGKMVEEDFQNDLSRIGYSIEDYLNSMGGEEGLIRHIMDNYGLKAAYLESIGKHIEKITQQQEVPRNFNPESADKYNRVMEILGVNTAEEIYEVDLKDARDNHGAELEEVFPGITKSALRMGKVLGMVGSYIKGKDSAPEFRTVTDISAMRKAVDDALDSEGFEAWVRNLFSGVVKDSGIYNNKDLFTPSGNRRTFKQTHLPVTLENIVKAMASQNDGNAKNVSSFNGVKTLRASTAETFRSIDEMHQRKDRLQHLTQEQADEITEGLQNRLFAVMEAIDNENSQQGDRNIYIRYDQIGETIAEIGESDKYDAADIQGTFSQYGRAISADTAQEVKQLLNDIKQMPVNIFEAKPQRVVSFDEAKVFVIPNNADVKLKQELLNRGYSIAEYDPNVEGDRQRVVNQFEEYKFSLSDVGEQPSTVGTPLKDLYFGEDIAPIKETVAPTIENAVDGLPFPDEIAPMTEEEANAVQDEKAKSDAKAEGQPKSRKQLHNRIIENIKSVFKGKGFDLDTVLRKAKNLSTFRTVDNTPQRVMEKALGYKEGQVLADLTVNKVAQNETEGIKWLNSFTDRKNGFLAQISKQYNIKPGSKESAAAQMYAEGFYVNENNDIVAYGDAELAQDFPNATVRSNIKGLAHDPRIRQIYDETLAAINEARARNAYPEIKPLDNYFLHFRAMDDTFSRLGLPFNPNDIRAKDLPTDLNGVTADLKPGQPYFASAMHRKGKRTSFDLLGGLERYLTSAKNQIYHIDDIQTLRALRNYIADTYGQASGLEGIDSLSEEEAQERIEQVYGSHLSTFAKFLNEEANVLAGKTALIDRGLEGIIGRRGITFINTLNRQVGSNMVGYNVSSSLTNFIPVAQTFAKSNKFDFIKAFAQTVSNKFGSIVGKSDGFAEKSPVIIRRKGADRFYRTPFQKVADTGYFLMSAVDNISTELIARTKFNELTRNGMSEQQAHFETDKWVSRLMGDRSLGQMPQLYNSKMLGIITKFQLEVRNQLDSQFYDTIQEARVSNEDIENGLARNAKTAAKVASTFVQLAVVQHLFGKAFESIAGYNPAFDIIEVLSTALGFDDEDDSEDTALDNIEQGFFELLEDLPYTSIFTGGGRIPISSALPISDLIMGEDEYGNEKSRLETLGEVAPYYFLPGGYGQLKKTKQGLGMFSDEHPVAGSYTDSGNLRFPVEDTLTNRIQAGIFGQYANDNAREYFDNDYAPLKEKQIQEYIDVNMPIKDYWEYRQGLAKQETLEDKFDYIAGLDLTVEQKNILINNVVNRKEEVDLESYDDFSSLEEFDFATKYPDKHAVAKSVGGYSSYKTYSEALYDIKVDKDENGKSINGSRKEKVVAWLNELDADYETKLILFKSEYPSDDTYNQEIIEYINSRDDLTYEERVAIYTELGFTVKDGYVYWD